jgi:hypothetical protein
VVREQMMEPDKNELLAAARHGNVDALQGLFAEHEANLFRLMYRMLGNRADHKICFRNAGFGANSASAPSAETQVP